MEIVIAQSLDRTRSIFNLFNAFEEPGGRVCFLPTVNLISGSSEPVAMTAAVQNTPAAPLDCVTGAGQKSKRRTYIPRLWYRAFRVVINDDLATGTFRNTPLPGPAHYIKRNAPGCKCFPSTYVSHIFFMLYSTINVLFLRPKRRVLHFS